MLQVEKKGGIKSPATFSASGNDPENPDASYRQQFSDPAPHSSYDPSHDSEDKLTAREKHPTTLDHTEISHNTSDVLDSITEEEETVGSCQEQPPSNRGGSLALISNLQDSSATSRRDSTSDVEDPVKLKIMGLAPINNSEDTMPQHDNPRPSALWVQTGVPVGASHNARTKKQSLPASQHDDEQVSPDSLNSNPAMPMDDDDDYDELGIARLAPPPNDLEPVDLPRETMPTATVSSRPASSNREVVASHYFVDRHRFEQEAQLATTTEFENEAIDVAGVRLRTDKKRVVMRVCLFVAVSAVVAGIVAGLVFGVAVGPGEENIANDMCLGAKGPLRDSVVRGSTVGSLSNEKAPLCDSRSRNGKYGAWYWLEGDENFVIADTCSNETNFDTQISVFEGSSCDELQCVAANDDFCGEQSTVSWRSRTGTNYYILVHGQNDTQGDFALGTHRSNRFEMVAGEIFREFGVQVNTQDQNSPQYRAAKWLEGESNTLVELPLESSEARLEFRQRFALAVFYYATRGREWENQLHFLSPESVCSWNGDDEQGVTCDDSGVVRSLSFGTYFNMNSCWWAQCILSLFFALSKLNRREQLERGLAVRTDSS